MPDMTLTLDALDHVRSLYDLAWLGREYNEVRLYKIEKYLVYRLERAGLAAPPAVDRIAGVVGPDLGGRD